jgi:ribosomal protein L24E
MALYGRSGGSEQSPQAPAGPSRTRMVGGSESINLGGERRRFRRGGRRAAFSLAHNITSSGLEQSARALRTSSILCAFFDKRLPDASLLFGPFWSFLESAPEACEGQWKIEQTWFERAALDGSGQALKLLVFRVNRLCRLLSLSDCWSSSIGRHLGFWLDTHMHLVLSCEKRRSGPVHDPVGTGTLFLYDWRYVPEDVTAALSLSLGGGGATWAKGTSIHRLACLFSRCLNNMSVNKSLGAIFAQFENDSVTKKTICCAVTRCLLGGYAGCGARASFHVRRAVHLMAADGVDSYFETITRVVEAQHRPVVLLCLREYAVYCVEQDMSLNTFLNHSTKWGTYAHNVMATTDSLRTILLSQYNVKIKCLLRWLSSDDGVYFAHFSRHAKRVPGITYRGAGKQVSPSEMTKMIRRYRDRMRAEKAIATESFFDPDGIGTTGLCFFRELKAGELLPLSYVRECLNCEDAVKAFAKILTAMREGTSAARLILEAPPPEFERASDCLELFRHSCESRRYRLPPSYSLLQLAALQKRFKDTTCENDEIMRRGAELLCCTGCRTVKNFVLIDGKKEQNAHVSHGYKRVCHDGSRLLCDEKRLYRCCKNVPLKRYSFIEKVSPEHSTSTFVLEIFGVAYVTTTCCGHISSLDSTRAIPGSPITCKRCHDDTMDSLKDPTVPVRSCHFCEQHVLRKKGSFTGIFTDENDSQRQLTFCKRHSRKFMKREHEPMDLAEVMREIPKRLRV